MQFLHVVQTMLQHKLNKDDLEFIIYMQRLDNQINIAKFDNNLKMYQHLKNIYSTNKDAYHKLINEKKLSNHEIEYMYTWIKINHGETTIYDFLNKNSHEKYEIYKFLYESYVVLPQSINNQDYLFVHAMPPEDVNMLRTMKENKTGYKYSELTSKQYEFMLQERDKSTYEQAKQNGFITICGHTPKDGNILQEQNKGFIRIDAGCGHKKNKNSMLALYCIDDDAVEYFEQKEAIQEQEL